MAQELTAPLAAPASVSCSPTAWPASRWPAKGRIPRPQTGSEWRVVTGLAMTGILSTPCASSYGLNNITAGRGALVVALNPVVVALAAWFLGQERMTPRKTAG